ncbi:MAG: extracellular solute-binding protein [Selenomonas sp.]|nr:extracellular solute-binding protein [Selenomonas sp.]
MKNLKNILRVLSLALATCMLFGNVAFAKAEEPLIVTMYLGCAVVEFPPDGNEIEKIIEEYVGGVDFKINAYSASVLHEMMPTLIAGGDLPMVVNVGGSQLTQSYLVSAMQAGEFWDVTDYLSTLDNFKDLNPASINNYAIGGRFYGLPLERGIARDSTCYRYDWLQNLGLEDPKTVDELVNMMKKFTTDDPDGNGIDDTYGTVTDPTGRIAVMLGAPNNWKYQDGQMIKAELTEEYMKALDISRELYAMGALHPEFAIRRRADYEGDFINGKGGVYFNVSTDITAFQSQMVQPEAVLHSNNLFANDDGSIYTAAGRGNNGVILLSKKAIPDEETLKKVINIFDRLADEEMCNLLALGQENVHYEVVDGVAKMLPDPDGSINSNYVTTIYNPYTVPLAVRWPNLRTMPVELSYGARRNLEVIEENAPYAVADDSMGLISELYNEIGSDLNTLMSDAKTLYIMGEIDKKEFQNRMEQWKKQGGDDIAAEYASLYEANRK